MSEMSYQATVTTFLETQMKWDYRRTTPGQKEELNNESGGEAEASRGATTTRPLSKAGISINMLERFLFSVREKHAVLR